jgi:hypothetical protein
MNFYLSAIDDQLRHENDAPSIGIILCKGKNEVIVEYALRDAAKPMGVAEYRLSAALPEPLRGELPTVAEFAREFPLMSLVKLRIEVERELRALTDHDKSGHPNIMVSLSELTRLGFAPTNTDFFRSALRTLNRAAHGLEVGEDEAAEASAVAAAFLAELREIRSRGQGDD